MKNRYYMTLLAALVAMTAYAASPLPSGLSPDPAVSTGVLPNGMSYYIAVNPSEKGMAEFALVRKLDVADSLMDRAVYAARASMTEVPRFFSGTVRDYAARHGAASSMCRRSVPVHVSVRPDAAVYRFGSFPVSGGESVMDSTLLMIFSMVEAMEDDVPAGDAVIVSGDVSKDAVLSKMKMLSMIVPAGGGDVPADTSYVWRDRDTVVTVVRADTSAAAARISVWYSSPRTPAEYMGTAVPVVSEHLAGILDRILGRRIVYGMKRNGIPLSGLHFRYAGSASGGGDEKYVISFTTDNSTAVQALGVLADVIADVDVNGVRESEYAGARNEYLLQQYRQALDPVTCNGRYVDECVSSFLYGSTVVSKTDRFKFLVRGDLPDSTRTRLFNNFASELLDSTRNLTVSVTADSARISGREIREMFDRAWSEAETRDTLTVYPVNMDDSLALASAPAERLKIKRTRKDPVSRGTMWTFSNGMKVVYKRMQTGGIFYYDMMIRGGYSVVPDLRRGEGAFYSDILETYDIAGLQSVDFNDIMLSEGITMSSEVTVSHISLTGMAPKPSLTLLFKCLRSVANSRTVNRPAFDYYAECEMLDLGARAGTMPARKAAIDSLMCPSYHYSSDKVPENLHPDACDRAVDFFDSHFSRVNDGVLMIVGDMEETAMRRFLQKNLSGFMTEPLALARIRLPYQPISGWTTHIVEGKRQSLDIAMSAPLPFSADNYMAMKVASVALESALNRKLCGSAASARVFCDFSAYPHERVSFLISVSDLDPSVLPLVETGKDPLVLLYDVRAVLSDLSSSPVDDGTAAICRDVVKNGVASLQNDPWYWVEMVKTRFTDGKDLNTRYAEKIDAVSAGKVMEMISLLASGSRVEYVVR